MQVGEHARGVNLLASVSLLPMYHWCVWEEDAAESLMDPRRIVWAAVLIMIDARAVWVTTTVAGVASAASLARDSVLREGYMVSHSNVLDDC